MFSVTQAGRQQQNKTAAARAHHDDDLNTEKEMERVRIDGRKHESDEWKTLDSRSATTMEDKKPPPKKANRTSTHNTKHLPA